ncbi:MAG: hypothetical protein QOE70_1839 [Chthoniobacter sp.]|jgi:hypothetical protein|nr:hypothetical protein [Chthoniobacter sp.]
MNPPLRCSSSLLSFVGALALAACAGPETATHVDASSQGTLIATTRANSGGHGGPAREGAGVAEGIVRRNGRLYYVKDGGTTLIQGRQRVTEGMYLEKNGDVTLADGRRVKLREGYLVTPAGEVLEAPPYLR